LGITAVSPASRQSPRCSCIIAPVSVPNSRNRW
jgi:hypothetical protein